MRATLRANVARIVYDVWKDQGEPDTIAASDVLQRYRQVIGSITSELLEGELYFMVDDPGPLAFLRVSIEDAGGELGYLGLTQIDANALLQLAGGPNM